MSEEKKHLFCCKKCQPPMPFEVITKGHTISEIAKCESCGQSVPTKECKWVPAEFVQRRRDLPRNTREMGVVDHVRTGKDEDRGFYTTSVFLDLEGSGQAFGFLVMDEPLMQRFNKALCETFDVRRVEQLVGMGCYALRCWGFHNDFIEGLETLDGGKRFTITGWRRKEGIFQKTPLEMRRESMEKEIAGLKRRIISIEEDLAGIDAGYVDWEREP